MDRVFPRFLNYKIDPSIRLPQYHICDQLLAAVLLLQRGMANQTLEFLCLECGRKDTAEAFGPFIRCPICNSSDVLNYRLWRKHGADTPPPRKGTLTLADFPETIDAPDRQRTELPGERIIFPSGGAAG